MLEVDDSYRTKRRDEGHDRWLVMRSAYAEYGRASEALECALQFADELTDSERIRLTLLERQQGVAFERYVEARMEFLEFQFDRSDWTGKGPAALPVHKPKNSGVSSLPAFAKRIPVLPVLAVILLCTAAFALIRQQKHLQGLEASRNQIGVTPNQTGAGEKLEKIPPQHSSIRDVGPTSPVLRLPKTAAAPRPNARKPPVGRQRRHQPALRVQPKQAGGNQALASATQSQRIGTRNYYRFSLAPSRKFRQIGPIKVAVWSVDSKRKTVRLSVRSNSMQIDVKTLQVSQPVWINMGSSEPLIELVADRIAGNRLDGHLVEPRNNNANLTASRFRTLEYR